MFHHQRQVTGHHVEKALVLRQAQVGRKPVERREPELGARYQPVDEPVHGQVTQPANQRRLRRAKTLRRAEVRRLR